MNMRVRIPHTLITSRIYIFISYIITQIYGITKANRLIAFSDAVPQKQRGKKHRKQHNDPIRSDR